MLRSILIALCSSEHSDAVVKLGVRWAKQLNAKLVGISAFDQATRRSAVAVEFLRLHDIEAKSRPSESIGPVAKQLLAEMVAI